MRLPDGWRNKIDELAKADHASMNATILRFIEPHVTGKAEVQDMVRTSGVILSKLLANWVGLSPLSDKRISTVRKYRRR